MMDRVIWRVIKPLNSVSGVPNRGIELDLLDAHLNSVHTPKPQDQNTIPIARELTDAVTTSRSEITTSKDKKLANKEDLLKGLKDIAEKRKTLHECTKKHFDESSQNTANQQNPVIISRLNKSKKNLIKATNLEEVLDIIKKGITIDSVEEPIPDNLHWMKIKIPKTVDTSGVFKKMERMAHGYFSTINQLSKQFPNHQIELQIEYSGPVTTKPSPLPFRRGNVPVVKYPKKILRSYNDSNVITMTTAAPTTTPSQISAVQDSNKSPIYLDDLKQALDEFEKKLASHSDCSGNHQNTATTGQKRHSPRPIQANRNIQEIMQLIGKGVKVQYNVPKPTDEDLDWLQIKIPNSS